MHYELRRQTHLIANPVARVAAQGEEPADGQGGCRQRSKDLCPVPVHDVVGGKGEEELVPYCEDEEHEPPEEDDLAQVRCAEADGRDPPVCSVVLQERVRVHLVRRRRRWA